MKHYFLPFILSLCLMACGQKKGSTANDNVQTEQAEAGDNKNNTPSDPDEPLVGTKFKDFTMSDINGNKHSLSEFIGKGKQGRKHYVLVDFWASWCRPCMMELPNVKNNWNMYRDQGFEVVGISLDSDPNAWKETVRSNGYDWTQLSDFAGFDSPTAELYGVEYIPWNILIDEDGTIVAANLRDQELSAKLKEIYKKW